MSKITKPWQEYVVNIEDHNQNDGYTLHLNIDATGKIFRIYTFKDEIPEFYKIDSDGDISYDKYGEEKLVNLITTPSKNNSLFVDLKVSQILPYLGHCYFGEEDVENFEKGRDLILINAKNKYKHLNIC